MDTEEDVLFHVENGCGLIRMNRPHALNALTLTMVRMIMPVLKKWAIDDSISYVVIEGAGEKGFCAGGDIRALHDWGKAGAPEAIGFYREEYQLNHLIKRFPKPYIALMDGITMGGGVGMSVHGTYRIVSPRTVFAMPETGIGLLPDVGGTYFLPRLSGKIGTYMALTGARLKAADCLYTSIATHYSDDMEGLRAALLAGGGADELIDIFTAHCSRPPEPTPLARQQADIDRLFGAPNIHAILQKLQEEGSDWAQENHAIISTKSPMSCAVALRQMQEGAAADFETCMQIEFRAVSRIMAGHDFYEGVRAVIIDKDNQPRWQPAAFADVTDAMIDAIFAPLARDELNFING